MKKMFIPDALLPKQVAELCIEYLGKHDGFRLWSVLNTLLPVSESFQSTLQRFHPDMQYADIEWMTQTLSDLTKHKITHPFLRMIWYVHYYPSKLQHNSLIQKFLSSRLEPSSPSFPFKKYKLIPAFCAGDFKDLNFILDDFVLSHQVFRFSIENCPEIAVRILLEKFRQNTPFASLILEIKSWLGKNIWNEEFPMATVLKRRALVILRFLHDNLNHNIRNNLKNAHVIVKSCLTFLKEGELIDDNCIFLPFGSKPNNGILLDSWLDIMINMDMRIFRLLDKRKKCSI